VSSLAVLARLDPRSVADLDEDEFGALVDAVKEREQHRAWTNLNEQLAAVVEALWSIQARLEAGVTTVQVKRTRKPKDPGQYPRPAWLAPSKPKDTVVFTSMRDALRMMKGGSGGS
jgi:hypothetical protein